VRNEGNLLHLQVLLLIRTLNEHLLDDDAHEDSDGGKYIDQDVYLRNLVAFLTSNGLD